MSRDGALDGLFAEATPTLRTLLRRAYELGYRDAIADAPPLTSPGDGQAAVRDGVGEPAFNTLPAPTENSAPGVERLAANTPPSTPQVTGSPPLLEWDNDSVHDDDDDDVRGHDGTRRHRRKVGIRATSTVGALKTKIHSRFRLNRFDIDVVIIRAGDKSRRQLPSHVALSAYAREE